MAAPMHAIILKLLLFICIVTDQAQACKKGCRKLIIDDIKTVLDPLNTKINSLTTKFNTLEQAVGEMKMETNERTYKIQTTIEAIKKMQETMLETVTTELENSKKMQETIFEKLQNVTTIQETIMYDTGTREHLNIKSTQDINSTDFQNATNMLENIPIKIETENSLHETTSSNLQTETSIVMSNEDKHSPSSCPTGFTLVGQQQCLLYLSQWKNWTEAQSECEGRGATLAHLEHSDIEAVRAYVDAVPDFSDSPWVAARQYSSGEFTWSATRAALLKNWAFGEPDNPGTDSCVFLSGDGQYRDYRCSNTRSFLCSASVIRG